MNKIKKISVSKMSWFFEKTIMGGAVAFISLFAVLMLVWMFYLLSGIEG